MVMATQKAVFPRDTGLQARMLLTLFLLGLLYVVFIAVLLSAGAGLVTVVVVMGGLSLASCSSPTSSRCPRWAPRWSRRRRRRGFTR